MKYLCKKEYTHSTTMFKVGEWYQGRVVDDRGSIFDNYIRIQYMNVEYTFYRYVFATYFHTVAEIREIEINKILN
jgi:hypothetical protein